MRSQRAAAALEALPQGARPELHRVDWADPASLEAAVRGCGAVVHLVGILKETRGVRYEDAHERTCERIADAAARAGVARIVNLGILGAAPDSPNACLASKGRAEAILLAAPTPATLLRLPMVLGRGELAAAALRAQASAPVTFLVDGGRSLEQPIDGRDVVAAILAALDDPEPGSLSLDLAGPESLSHRALVGRVAALLGRRPRIVSIPGGLARALARAAERWLADPPITPAMLGVLEHDDRIDPKPAAERLGISLTPLDDTLHHTFAPGSETT